MNMKEADAYAKHRNLKLAAAELGINWQTLYCRLKKAGIPVTGDKARYGSAKDRLASFAERLFAEDVPQSIDANAAQFQASVDFVCFGWMVDVKAAAPSDDGSRWGFCINKQKDKADFFVMYAFSDKDVREVKHVLLMPREIATAKSTISLPITMQSKWADYEVSRNELKSFFDELGEKP